MKLNDDKRGFSSAEPFMSAGLLFDQLAVLPTTERSHKSALASKVTSHFHKSTGGSARSQKNWSEECLGHLISE